MHEQVVKQEGKAHNRDGKCPICMKRIQEEKIAMYQDIEGDPAVTPGPNQQSVTTLKDMYGIFEAKEPEKKFKRQSIQVKDDISKSRSPSGLFQDKSIKK